MALTKADESALRNRAIAHQAGAKALIERVHASVGIEESAIATINDAIAHLDTAKEALAKIHNEREIE